MELKQLGSTKASRVDSPEVLDRDDNELQRLGKKPVLKRNFGFMSMLGFSCTVLITWEAALILFLQPLQNGGPAGLIYGFILVWAGNLSTFMTLSELASMAPTSGGQYHWVSMLSPPGCQKFLSYITGWLSVGGWQAAIASGAFLTGGLIQGTAMLCNPSYVPQPWHATLISWAVVAYCVFVNTILSRMLPKLEGCILILHILGFFGILIPLVVLGPHDSASNVFETWINAGGEDPTIAWPTQGLSFFVGLLGNVFAFVGADGAIHMAEEIKNAAVVVPRSIILSIIINGTLGFAMVIATMICLGDLSEIVQFPFPFMVIFLNAVRSLAGAAFMISLVIILALMACVGLMASCSRITWAFSRDRGVPGWRHLSKLDSRTSVPVYSVVVTCVITSLLQLIQIGSVAAFNNIVSLSISGLYSSYFIVAVLFLWRRITGAVHHAPARDYDHDNHGPALVNAKGTDLYWGPWRLPGWLGVANNAFAVVYLLVIFVFSFFPPVNSPAPETMNFCVLITGAWVLFAVGYYLVRARRVYTGPVVEI